MSTSDEQHAPDEPATTDETVEPAGRGEPTPTPADAPSGETGAVRADDERPVTDAAPAAQPAPRVPAADERPEPSPAPAAAAARPTPPPGTPAVPAAPASVAAAPTAPQPASGGMPTAPQPASGGMPTAPMRPVSTPAPADLDASARHAVVRPAPVPPDPAVPVPARPVPGVPERTATGPGPSVPGAGPAAGTLGAGAALGAARAGAAGIGAATSGAAGIAAGGTPLGAAGTPGQTASSVALDAADEAPDLFPDPNAPRTITLGTHVLGVLVGIVLPVVAALVTVLGISRILVVEATGWVASVDVLGIVLVTLGALLLLACALLSLWTPTVGLVGGAILTITGAFALYAPGVTRSGVLRVLSSDGWRPTVEETVVVATSGTLVVVGVLLLGAGIVSTVARRHGIHLGAFRERHRTA